ncbi:MerR family transcriptional regulator [Bacillus cereus group sp. BY6-1LC]|uniref:MerR family transcriptional regulator n=1 Tax=Bacillus cereus group sp. BY6-1LC TaxID=3018077 RepID=UPI0022E7F06B|nr:MerR family transcriptional regulator [Bacillus cereus group sp. BY6-1LC]MDA1802873.1 MerR family transcriptional regulator [Bacillus cereus group sp. BY6-1LC]
MNEFGYYAKTVANDLEISPNTLRRWSIELENRGYKFERTETNKRVYYERDYKAFRELKKLLDAGVSMESASRTVVNSFRTSDNESQTPVVHEQETAEIERSALQDEEKFKLMMQEAMMEVAANTIKPLMTELQDVKSELVVQREENQRLNELLQLKLNETGQVITDKSDQLLLESSFIKKQLEDKTEENEKLKNLLEEVKAKAENIEKQTEQEEILNKINRNIKSFDDRLKETVNQKKQEQNKSFFQRLFNK